MVSELPGCLSGASVPLAPEFLKSKRVRRREWPGEERVAQGTCSSGSDQVHAKTPEARAALAAGWPIAAGGGGRLAHREHGRIDLHA